MNESQHRKVIERAVAWYSGEQIHKTMRRCGGLAEFMLPPDLMLMYRVTQVFEAASVVFADDESEPDTASALLLIEEDQRFRESRAERASKLVNLPRYTRWL